MNEEHRGPSSSSDKGKRPLDWTEMLNEEAQWHDYADFLTWFSSVAPQLAEPGAEQFEEFRTGLRFIRLEAAKIYFDGEVDIAALNNRLANISFQIQPSWGETRLPLLVAQTASENDVLAAVAGAIMVDFAKFVADFVAGGPGLSRCEGVFRDQRGEDLQLTEFEEQYRDEIDLLKDAQASEDPSLQRCADFFVGRRKARFCSDTCRFMTFRISKQLNEPGYLADKQRRYRNRKR